MRCVPNLVIAAPRDEFQLRNLMFTLQLEKHNFPSVIRYPRGKSTQAKSKIEFKEIEIGKGEKIKDGKDIAILSIGTPGNTAIKLANDLEEENLNIAVFDMIFVKPLDNKLLTEIFNNYKHIITIEDNSIIGGFGSAISEFMVDNKFNSKIYRFGIPDRFISHGSQQQLIEECEFDYNTLKLFIKNLN
jgi:1-deoxy-D-xylulose-5-phosphate synthase